MRVILRGKKTDSGVNIQFSLWCHSFRCKKSNDFSLGKTMLLQVATLFVLGVVFGVFDAKMSFYS